MGIRDALPFCRPFRRITEIYKHLPKFLLRCHCVHEETNRYLHWCGVDNGRFGHSIQHLPDILHPQTRQIPVSY